MLVNAEFSRRAIVTPDQYRWASSPQAGVERVMLDRVGDERARATSIVRYAAGSRFPRHSHPGGEEILVLSGTFSDASGDYPAGWYLRNPPGSSHQPWSAEGALILVKLWQMSPTDRATVRIDTRAPANWSDAQGRQVCELFESESEHVQLVRIAGGDPLLPAGLGGAELLVLEGELEFDGRRYGQGSWLRLPAGGDRHGHAASAGVKVYLKTGHVADPKSLAGTSC